MNSIHPRFQNRLESTLQRRMAELESAYECARGGLLAASEMLASLPPAIPAEAVAELRDEGDRLLGVVERLRSGAAGPDELNRVIADLDRFADHVYSIKSALTAAAG